MSDTTSPLARELEQRVPFRNRSHEVTVGLVRTATLLELVGTRLLAPAGITLAQYNVLRILRGAAPDGLPTLAVRKRLITAAPAITRLIDRLEGAGLAERIAVPDDRRQKLCRITPEGLALLERLDPGIAALDDLAAQVLSDEELARLTEYLDRIREKVRRAHC